MPRLNALQRAYLIGLKRGRAQKQRELDEIVGDLLSLCSRVQDERDKMRAELHLTVLDWNAELAALSNEVAEIGREHERIKAVAEAVVERARDPSPLH